MCQSAMKCIHQHTQIKNIDKNHGLSQAKEHILHQTVGNSTPNLQRVRLTPDFTSIWIWWSIDMFAVFTNPSDIILHPYEAN